MRTIARAIDLFLIYWLFIATTAVVPLLILDKGEGQASSGNDTLRLLIVPSLLMMPILVLSRLRDMVSLLIRNPLIPLLLIWVWLSILWSVSPDVAFRRALSLTTYTLLACYMVLRHDPDWVFRTLSWMIITLLAVSVLFAVFLPDLSQMPDGRGLRGIFTHKNGMGEFLILSFVILPPAIRQGLIPRVIGCMAIACALVLLVLVNSATATIVALTVITLYVILAVFCYSWRIGLIASAFGIAAGSFLLLLVIINIDSVFALTGRDATLTGRTELWQYVLIMIEKRWLEGYGYGSFWEVLAFSKYAADSLQWDIPNAHNGFLEVALGLGVVGLMLILFFFANAIYRMIKSFRQSSYFPSAILLTLLVAYLLRAFTESNLLGQNSIDWILVVTGTVFLTPGLSWKIQQAPGAQGNPNAETNIQAFQT